MLLTARTRPPAGRSRSADLGSRLKALPVVAMAPPDDALLRAVLVKLFADRQLAVDESLIGYRGAADRAVVRGARRRWSRASTRRRCASKRPLTRAFAAEILRADRGLTGRGADALCHAVVTFDDDVALLSTKAFGHG